MKLSFIINNDIVILWISGKYTNEYFWFKNIFNNDFIQKIIEPEKLSFVIVGRPDGDDLEQKPEEKIAKK